jgi:hypothetical protein
MLLTEGQARSLDWAYSAGKRFHAADIPTVALGAPAALLAFNASDFASPWISPHWPISHSSIKQACSALAPTELFVLVPGDVPLDGENVELFDEALDGCGVNFPDDFTLLDEHHDRDPKYSLQLWSLD